MNTMIRTARAAILPGLVMFTIVAFVMSQAPANTATAGTSVRSSVGGVIVSNASVRPSGAADSGLVAQLIEAGGSRVVIGISALGILLLAVTVVLFARKL